MAFGLSRLVKKPIKKGLLNLKILLSNDLFLLLDLINVIDINNKEKKHKYLIRLYM